MKEDEDKDELIRLLKMENAGLKAKLARIMVVVLEK